MIKDFSPTCFRAVCGSLSLDEWPGSPTLWVLVIAQLGRLFFSPFVEPENTDCLFCSPWNLPLVSLRREKMEWFELWMSSYIVWLVRQSFSLLVVYPDPVEHGSGGPVLYFPIHNIFLGNVQSLKWHYV